MHLDPDLRSGIQKDLFQIQDQVSKRHLIPDLGSGSATLINGPYLSGTDQWFSSSRSSKFTLSKVVTV